MRRRPLLLATCLALPVALGALTAGVLAQAEGERRFDAAAARIRAGLGPDGALEWTSRTIDPVSGRAVLQGVTIRRGAERMTVVDATLDDLRADGVGRALLNGVRVEAPDPDGGPRPMVATAVRLAFSALSLPTRADGPAVDWSGAAIEAAVGEELRVETPGVAVAELARMQVAGYAPGTLREAAIEGLRFVDRREGETRIGLARARLAGAALPRFGQPFDPWVLAADSALIEGAEVAVEKENVAFRLGRTQLDGWGEGRLATLAMAGLAVQGDAPNSGPFAAEVARIGFGGVALRDTAYAIAHNLNPPQGAPGQDQSAAIEGIALALGGTPVLSIAAIRGLNTWDAAAPGVEVGRLGVEGLRLDLPPEYGGAMLDSLGFKGIQGGLGVDTRLTRKEGRLVIEHFFIQADGMGRFGTTMDIRGFDVPVPGQPATDDPLALVSNWAVASMSLRYADQGLLRALVARQAAEERVPERQLRERYATMALRTPLPGAGRGKEAPGVTRVREAFASFARDLGTIELAIRPAKPVAFLQAMGFAGMPPDQAVRELNLTATATPPGR
ncbi:hypothetical protein EAH89_07015 [Roseomonas nepalensis]|uniref:DUF945 family protein n=1 Tax=Muricoccus nepalensis TaxID=1854500 RepID=A0A502GDH9_9PROT|nr:hypothetical protein [Roseomonas nepalensis]TPG59096.1 hypothetical protein EAH89_07015 [Roseomonas nepalensis]